MSSEHLLARATTADLKHDWENVVQAEGLQYQKDKNARTSFFIEWV